MKLTRLVQRRITADWLTQFPELGTYAALHLLRRVGPMLEGIVLDRSSGSDDYRPTFHVHSLLRRDQGVSLTLYHRLRTERTGAEDSISVARHDSRYAEAARRLASQSPLPLSGDLRLSEVLEAYRCYATKPENDWYADTLYEDMAAYLAWFGETERASRVIAEGFAKLGEWSPDALRQIGGREKWRKRVTDLVADEGRLHAIMDEQIRALRLETIPVSHMVLG